MSGDALKGGRRLDGSAAGADVSPEGLSAAPSWFEEDWQPPSPDELPWPPPRREPEVLPPGWDEDPDLDRRIREQAERTAELRDEADSMDAEEWGDE